MTLMLLGTALFGAVTARITSYHLNASLSRARSKVEADVALGPGPSASTQLGALQTTPRGCVQDRWPVDA